ncbi:isochorismatase family cysteine hydrolase [Fodinicurvata halophila]|uniref:Isochorismatase family cysteine hydrolase n=1 Tax=Fodinicurvata halophila TaxID=1419723 RepID=A0ABV8ULS6_9PROT
MSQAGAPERNASLDAGRTAILVIDVQKGIFRPEAERERPYFFRTARDMAIPNMRRLVESGRAAGAEVIYTVIQSLTRDGRDRSLDYKQTGFHIPPGSHEAQVIDELTPAEDELVLPKTSSSLFNSTIFEYLMRNMGLDTVVTTGFLTDQCIDHTVRDGADRGFRMVCPVDACTTDSEERHLAALNAFKGYCRQVRTEELLTELG